MCLFGAYHQSGREVNGKILPWALQHIPHKHRHKNSPSNPLSFSAMKTCTKNAWGQLHLYLFIIFFRSVFVWVLMSMIGYSGCIPLLIKEMSESYLTKNGFLSSYPYTPPFTLISGDVCCHCADYIWYFIFISTLILDINLLGMVLVQMSSYLPFFSWSAPIWLIPSPSIADQSRLGTS